MASIQISSPANNITLRGPDNVLTFIVNGTFQNGATVFVSNGNSIVFGGPNGPFTFHYNAALSRLELTTNGEVTDFWTE